MQHIRVDKAVQVVCVRRRRDVVPILPDLQISFLTVAEAWVKGKGYWWSAWLWSLAGHTSGRS